MSITKSKIEKAVAAYIKENNKKAKEQLKLSETDEAAYDNLTYEDRIWEIEEDSEYIPETLYEEHCPFESKGLKFECEDEEGGHEGGGDYCHKVFKVTDTTTNESCLIKYDGYYASYDGSNYDNGFYFCEAYIEPVTKYRKLKGKKNG